MWMGRRNMPAIWASEVKPAACLSASVRTDFIFCRAVLLCDLQSPSMLTMNFGSFFNSAADLSSIETTSSISMGCSFMNLGFTSDFNSVATSSFQGFQLINSLIPALPLY